MSKTKKTPGLPKNGHPIKVWAIFHCEIWQTKPNTYADEMLFHVASSLEKAEACIKDVHIFGDAWWLIVAYKLDNPDWDEDAEPGSQRYYGNKGRPLKKSPYARACKVFEKENPKGYKE